MLVFLLELIGTVAFAASGAVAGIGRRMDIFGVCMMGVTASAGGGVIRDLVLGNTPPSVFQNSSYVITAVLTACLVFGVFYFKKELLEGNGRQVYGRMMLVMDSIGLGIFTAVGVTTGIRCGYQDNLFLLVFVGTVTGVGGGVLRDMMAGLPPYIFVHHIYACASMAGAFVCAVLCRVMEQAEAMVLSLAVVVLIRYFAVRYRWNLPRPGKAPFSPK